MSEYDRQSAELTASILSLPDELKSRLLAGMSWDELKKKVPKSVQAVLAAGTGVGSTIAGGYIGALGAALPGPEGQGAEWLKRVQDKYTYQPTSEAAQKGLQIAAAPGEALRSVGAAVGDPVAERFGPLAGTAANIMPDALSMLLAPGVPRAFGSAGEAIATAKPAAAAGSRGAQAGMIDLRRSPRVADKNADPVFPGIYEHPAAIVARAAEQRAPETSAMNDLFGVTRTDLDAETLLKQDPSRAADIYIPTRTPAHVQQITVPGNARRLRDTLELASEEPKLAGSYGWYMNDPLYHRFVKVLGPVEGSYAYDRFHQLGSGMSPGSEVPTEILRSSAAYTMDRQGRLPDFLNPANLPPEGGHIYHNSAHASAVNRLQNTGNFLSPVLADAPKTRIYYPSRTGDNYFWPTGDAHYVRALGAPDVRPHTTKKGVKGPATDSVSATESAPLGEWFAKDVAGPLGMTGSPAQALQWNVFAPATGVTSPLSAPFLELFSNQVRKAAQRKGVPINEELDNWIRGKGDYLGKNEQSRLLQEMTAVA